MKSPNISDEFILQKRIEISARLKEIRIKRGLTGDELGDLIGLSKNHISRIESGKYNFNLDTLIIFSVALDFKIEILS